jgi:hypothetical protein
VVCRVVDIHRYGCDGVSHAAMSIAAALRTFVVS